MRHTLRRLFRCHVSFYLLPTNHSCVARYFLIGLDLSHDPRTLFDHPPHHLSVPSTCTTTADRVDRVLQGKDRPGGVRGRDAIAFRTGMVSGTVHLLGLAVGLLSHPRGSMDRHRYTPVVERVLVLAQWELVRITRLGSFVAWRAQAQ